MIQLFRNIENYKNLCLRDMAVVAKNYVYFVPEHRAEEYSKKAIPLVHEAHTLVREYFSAFEEERKELSSIIEEYFDKDYFQQTKDHLKKNMFDTNYALKDYLNEMTVEQLATFGLSLFAGAMRSDLFMTEENYLMFSWDLGRLIGNVGALHGPLDNVSKKDLIDIYLKYIDLNVILADNVAESILSGADLEEVVKYIGDVEKMKYNLLYKATILM